MINSIVQPQFVPAAKEAAPAKQLPPLTQPEMLMSMAMSDNAALRKRVAACHLTPTFALKLLAVDPHRLVRLTVAQNSNAPYSALVTLASDPDPDVRMAVAGNTRAPLFLLSRLSHDDDPIVASCASRSHSVSIGKY